MSEIPSPRQPKRQPGGLLHGSPTTAPHGFLRQWPGALTLPVMVVLSALTVGFAVALRVHLFLPSESQVAATREFNDTDQLLADSEICDAYTKVRRILVDGYEREFDNDVAGRFGNSIVLRQRYIVGGSYLADVFTKNPAASPVLRDAAKRVIDSYRELVRKSLAAESLIDVSDEKTAADDTLKELCGL